MCVKIEGTGSKCGLFQWTIPAFIHQDPSGIKTVNTLNQEKSYIGVVSKSNRKLLLWLPTHYIQSEFKLHNVFIPFYIFIFTFILLHVYK